MYTAVVMNDIVCFSSFENKYCNVRISLFLVSGALHPVGSPLMVVSGTAFLSGIGSSIGSDATAAHISESASQTMTQLQAA